MTEQETTGQSTSDGLGRWLLGGLAGGALILGLLVGAYTLGYHRGQDNTRSTGGPAAVVPTTTTTATISGPIPVTASLVARGKDLYTTDGCSACHSLSGASGVGPSLAGVAGGTVTLADGQTLTADDAYLERSIVDADAEIVKGYSAGVMPVAVETYGLGGKPNDVRALVAFIKSHR